MPQNLQERLQQWDDSNISPMAIGKNPPYTSFQLPCCGILFGYRLSHIHARDLKYLNDKNKFETTVQPQHRANHIISLHTDYRIHRAKDSVSHMDTGQLI